MSLSSVDLTELRPLDRVLAFVDYNIPPEKKRAGTKLPTTREVSDLLNVSPATVRNAYQVLAERGLARSDVGSGTYWTEAVEKMASGAEVVIGVNAETLHPGENATRWGDRILGGLVRGMFNKGFSPRLKAVPILRDGQLITAHAELKRLLEGVNAFVVMPFAFQETLMEMLVRRGIWTACVNPPTISSTSDFVSPDYFAASKRVGMAFAAAKRKRALLFLSPGTEQSKSCQLRLAGFVSGLHAGEHAPEFRKLTIEKGDDPDLARRVFTRFLAEGWVPDAVYTAGDTLAQVVMEVAAERGLRIPDAMSVIGGTGLAANLAVRNSSLTSMVQPLEEMGQNLASMLLEKRRNAAGATPGIVIPMHFWLGKTTLPLEDEILSQEV